MKRYFNDLVEVFLACIWYRKWKILFTGIAIIGIGTAILRIFSTVSVGVNMLLEEEKPEAPIGFYEWEMTDEVFLKRLKETIASVGEKGNCVVFIGSIYTPEEAMYVTKQEVTEFNRIVNAKYADLNAGILAKIPPTFQYKLEAYLLKEKNFIILVPKGTDITEFFTTEEIQKII